VSVVAGKPVKIFERGGDQSGVVRTKDRHRRLLEVQDLVLFFFSERDTLSHFELLGGTNIPKTHHYLDLIQSAVASFDSLKENLPSDWKGNIIRHTSINYP